MAIVAGLGLNTEKKNNNTNDIDILLKDISFVLQNLFFGMS